MNQNIFGRDQMIRWRGRRINGTNKIVSMNSRVSAVREFFFFVILPVRVLLLFCEKGRNRAGHGK